MSSATSLPKRVAVKWYDIVRSTEPWSSHSDLDDFKPVECFSTGWLISTREDHIVLATHIGEKWDEESMGILVAIPMGVIDTIYELTVCKDLYVAPKIEGYRWQES